MLAEILNFQCTNPIWGVGSLSYVSNDRTDYNTLIPVLEKHKEAFRSVLEEVTADSGYCSEKNLLYLKENKIDSYIKL